MRLLTVQARGRVELSRALEQRGFESGAVREAIGRLEREGWLDDLAAARSAARARAGRYGRARIERELSARGFSGETVAAALAEIDPEGEEKALARLFTKLRRSSSSGDTEKSRRRVWNALSRRGFPAAAISAKMKDWPGNRGAAGRELEDEEP